MMRVKDKIFHYFDVNYIRAGLSMAITQLLARIMLHLDNTPRLARRTRSIRLQRNVL